MNTNKPIQIFKPGAHTAMSGATLAFSEADLAACAAAYDPAKHEAPIVVGHPKHADPAYGWVKSLAFAGGGLDAKPAQLDAAFAEMVGAGRFKKVSASFYTPDSPQNPVPGVYYLRHVGFLGAQPPAVKGLRAPEFAENEVGVVEFGDWNDRTIARLFRGLRNFFIAEFGQDKADQALDEWNVQMLADDAAQPGEPTDPATPTSFSEAPSPEGEEMSPEDKARLAALEAENATLKAGQAAFAEAEANRKKKATHDDHLAFAEGLVKDGKLLPAHRDLTVAAMDHLAAPDTPLEFGEGDAKKPLIESFKAYLAAQPKQVEFGEIAGGAGATGDADLTPEAIAAKAVEFQEAEAQAGRTISATAAVAHVTKGSK